jgi:hypothetical protein
MRDRKKGRPTDRQIQSTREREREKVKERRINEDKDSRICQFQLFSTSFLPYPPSLLTANDCSKLGKFKTGFFPKVSSLLSIINRVLTPET